MKRTLSLLLTIATLVAMISAFAVTPVAAAETRTPLAVDFVEFKAYDDKGVEYTTYDTNTLGAYYGNCLDKIFDPTNASRACPFLKIGHRMEVVGKLAEPARITDMQMKGWTVKSLTGIVIQLSKDGANWVTAFSYYSEAAFNGSIAAKTVIDAPIVDDDVYSYVKVLKSGTHQDNTLSGVKGAYLDLFFVAFYSDIANAPKLIEASYSKTLTTDPTTNMEKFFDFENKDLCKMDAKADRYLVEGKFAHPTTITGVYLQYSASVTNKTNLEASVDGVNWTKLGTLGNIWYNVEDPVRGHNGIGYIPIGDGTTAYNYVRLSANSGYASWAGYSVAFVGTEQEQNNGFGYQTKVDADKWALRLIAAADVLDYDAVGFEITATGEGITDKAWDESTETVYTAVYEQTAEAAEPVVREAAYFNGEYLYTAVITGISIADYADITFTVKPYVIRDGVKLYSAPRVIVLNDGVAA